MSAQPAKRTIYLYRGDLRFIKTFATEHDYDVGDVLRFAARGEYEVFDREEVPSESGEVELRYHVKQRD